MTARPRRFVRIRQPAGEPWPLWTTGGPGGELWVLTREARIDRYDLSDGSRTGSLPVRLAGTVAVIPTPDGLVYVTRGGELARADADRRADRLAPAARQHGSPAADHRPNDLDPRLRRGRRTRPAGGQVDLRSGRVLSSTGLPEFGVAGMADVGGDVWLSTPPGKT